jgi:predicted MPP superfamily phosphohydrolase
LELKSSKPLPKDYKVVMASDLHLGYHNPRKELARWVDMINAERPDFILIAGDIIDGSMRPLIEERMAEEFHRLQAPVYACLGNHEFYAGHPEAKQFYKDAGIHLLIDEAVVVDSAIVIIGRDDRTNMRRKPVKELVDSLQSSIFRSALPLGSSKNLQYSIVLDHQPYNLDRAETAGIDFQLSGHTHRGQVWPISWITDYIYECSWGSHQRGNTQFYISSGLGIWGGKFRIGTQSEYVVATLTSDKSLSD